MKITDIKESVELNGSQKATLLAALSIAVERFSQDAMLTRKSSNMTDSGLERLIRQYEKQAQDADELRERIKQSRWIRLGPVRPGLAADSEGIA